jgi:chromate reductase, NAD(P)H dehydrogenase (quinone)
MTEQVSMKLLGISGSLRKGSYNMTLLKVAAGLMPPDMTMDVFDLIPLPMFNQDFEDPFPQPVAEFRNRISQADALLIACPEYNTSLTAPLKNALDWASRKPEQPLNGKPVGIIGASTGHFGTVRAQLHLRQVLTHIGALPMGKPEVLVSRAEKAFDDHGTFVDPVGRGFLEDFLKAFACWIFTVSRDCIPARGEN